ncbi:MAG: deoxynucleoside kinase [Salinivirgaceae bacterium]|nr:deoxynucleoside kinase [Salinivirgaceae bacterium]MBR3566817.1 deoxynucleoside kinase [Salinivirgaceae bacterium]MBR4621308.1 deoxynucleoside kinase [Salinivirgaceae bacterium]MBR5644239.1 deoxynucleoside kinase [Salinivirgaceae bacterium]
MYIGIAGNIGSGKTTLTGLLAKNFKWEAHYEEADNPYMNDFYNDMQRWSFNLQIYFLNSRYNQILQILKSGKTIIQDRTIYEDAHIFAPNLHDMGLLSTRDFNTYFSSFELMSKFIQPPDLLIYLRASVPTLVRNIQKRGRDYESSIRLDYLKRLNERYEAWIAKYDLGKLLIFDVDDMNFTEKPEDLRTIIDRVDAEINGLFKQK